MIMRLIDKLPKIVRKPTQKSDILRSRS